MAIERLPGAASYSDAVTVEPAGRWIFVSGQIGVDEAGQLVDGDFAAEADRTFANIAAILERAGARLENVVKITAYVVDLDRHFQEMGAARTRAFCENLPVSATLGVSALAFGAKLEIEATAFVAAAR